MKKILLLSGYDAASHCYWRQLLADNLPQYQWTQLALADRNFSWRVRGSSLNFAYQFSEEISKDYDLVIATSMVDFASLRGFVPQLAKTPSLVYFHENQFVYPLSKTEKNSELHANAISAQLTSIYSALCADKILFNSNYNLASFIAGAQALLTRLPDKLPQSLIQNIRNKSQVLAVPLALKKEALKVTNSVNTEVPHIVWNHRWEYDKQPQVLLGGLLLLKKAGYLFKLHLIGQSFRKIPDCFAQAKIDFVDEIESFGFQTKANYERILELADIVISTALHDFQGLSIMEGISHGCLPIAPNRVAYPEYIVNECLYEISDEPEHEAHNLFLKLVEVIDKKRFKTPCLSDISSYSCDSLLPRYEAIFETLTNQ